MQNGNGIADMPLDIAQKLNNSTMHGGNNGMAPVAPDNEYNGNQPNIHPGCISSTGRNGRTSALLQQPQHLLHTVVQQSNGGGGGITQSLSGGLSSVSLSGHLPNVVMQADQVINPLLMGQPQSASAQQMMQQLFQNSSEIIWPHP